MKNARFILILVLFAGLISCNRNAAPDRTDTTTSGTVRVACDEGLAPILKEEASVFQLLNEDAEVKLNICSEAEAFKLLMKDSIRLMVAGRDITSAEKQQLIEMRLVPRSTKIAVDAIALITNRSNPNDKITVSQIKSVLDGKTASWSDLYSGSALGKIRVVFDNTTSGTVRYVMDSITKGQIRSKNVYARKTSKEVIDYVEKTPDALGIIGVNWITNPDDTTRMTFNKRIRVMSVSPYETADEDNSYPPLQAYILLQQYPLLRDVYMIITDPPGYLPSGFMNFVGGERGQRIVLKSGLVPATKPMRLINVKQ